MCSPPVPLYLYVITSDYVKRTHYNAPQSLFHYRQQALNGIWRAQQAAKKAGTVKSNPNITSKDSKIVEEWPMMTSKNEYTDADLTTLMLFPLIESQAKTDPGMRHQIVELLLAFLQNLRPLSVKGPRQQLDSIETLLIHWLHQDENVSETTINCLLALACARDSIDTLINTIDVLRKTLTAKGTVGNA